MPPMLHHHRKAHQDFCPASGSGQTPNWRCLVSGLPGVVKTAQRLMTPLREGGWGKLPPSQRYFLSNDNMHRKQRRMAPTWSQFTGTPIIYTHTHTLIHTSLWREMLMSSNYRPKPLHDHLLWTVFILDFKRKIQNERQSKTKKDCRF